MRVLDKQVCIVTKRELETAPGSCQQIVFLKMAGGVLKFDIFQKTQVFSNAGMWLKPHS